MAVVEDDRRHAANALLHPVFFSGTHLGGKALVAQNSQGLSAIQPDFSRTIGQYAGVRQIASVGKVRCKKGLF